MPAGKGSECDGCTFKINPHNGRAVLISTDKARACLHNWAPVAKK